MQIIQQTIYTVDNLSFSTIAKAEDYLQEKVLTQLRSDVMPKDIHLKYSSVVKIAEYLIENRLLFADLLGYELPQEVDEDDENYID